MAEIDYHYSHNDWSWIGWIEGPARDGVRRLHIKVYIDDTRAERPNVTVLEVRDATEWNCGD